MSLKTDLPAPDERPEFSNEYLLSLVAAAVVVLVLIFVIAPLAGNPLHLSRSAPYLYAWVIAGGITIAQGLSEFSGHAPETLSMSVLVSVLVSLLVVGVVAPTLTLKLMHPPKAGAAPQGSRAFYLFGLIIAVTFSVTVAPTGYLGWRVAQSLRSAQAVQRNKDLMINEANAIAMHVQVHRLVPKRLGGGEGMDTGFTLPPELAATDQATWVVSSTERHTVLLGTSKRYAQTSISVEVDAYGHLNGWKYTGLFE